MENDKAGEIHRKEPMDLLQQYVGKDGYCLTLPLAGEIHMSPFVAMDLILVKIDTRLVAEGGEVHNMHGTFMPAAPAVYRLCDAWGIDITENTTNIIEPYHWATVTKGKRRRPDGTWREGIGEYEFDAELRGKELRMQMKGKDESTIRKMCLDLKKFGRQRCVTGAQLVLIRKLTGLKTGFKTTKELEQQFVAYRFVDDVAAMMADPDMRRAITAGGSRATQEIFGSSERDVTPAPEQIAAPSEEQGKPDPFAVDETALTPEQEARAKLIEWGNSEELKGKDDAIVLIGEMVANTDATLEAMQNLIGRIEMYVAAKQAQANGGTA